MSSVRVRFAPSPTGPLHIGGVRTALFDYLFARKNHGTFILRIEDTDSTRFVPGAEDYIYEALEWCGLIPDEGPRKGGPYAPYRQSERLDIYKKYAEQILASGHAYMAFDTEEDLENIRAAYEAKGQVFSYGAATRCEMKNSISLPDDEVKKLLSAGVPYVLRFRMPTSELVEMHDEVRGHFSVNTDTLDDKVLVKNDGMPTYHFANVVDDYEMKISHVIRGEEWLPSMPLHVLLYRAMGWSQPIFAHLPLILKPEGKGKLSKRDGAKFGFPVFPLSYTDPATGETSEGYREEGYLPDALLNFLALLGWNPGEDREIMSLEEMVDAFTFEKINKSGARFRKDKAEWFNHQYIQQKSAEELYQIISESYPELLSLPKDKSLKIIELLKDRATYPADIIKEGGFFFSAPKEFEESAVAKAWSPTAAQGLTILATQLQEAEFISSTSGPEEYKKVVEDAAAVAGMGIGKIMMPLRLALVGALKGPDVPVIMQMLGKQDIITRIYAAIEKLN